MKKFRQIILLVLIFAVSSFPLVYAWEIDETSTVTRIVDGDSFYITNDEVRLADVSAPEWDEPGGSLATYAISGFIENEQVYLDTDQRTGRGPYGRLIAVVYIEYNSTHYLNVNQALLEQGVVTLTDYTNNEFSPSTWTLYTRYAYTEPTTIDRIPPVATDLITSLIAIALMYGLYRIGKPTPGGDGTIWRTGLTKYSLIFLALLGIRAISLYYSVSHILVSLYMALYVLSFIGVLFKKKAGSILVMIVVCLEIFLLIRIDGNKSTILWDLFLLYLAFNEVKQRRTIT